MAEIPPLTDAQVEAAFKENVIRFPKVERLPVDPLRAGQQWSLFSFKFLPKPVNGVYGFLKPRGSYANEVDWENEAKNIIRTIDSKHKLWPYETGRWMPITTNEEFAKETLQVSQQEELKGIYNQQESSEDRQARQKVMEVRNREKKLREEALRKEPDQTSLDYYAQQVMKIQQLESWLEMMRKRKRDMIKALKNAKDEIVRLDAEHPEYVDAVDDKIRAIKEEIGLDADAPIDQPSATPVGQL